VNGDPTQDLTVLGKVKFVMRGGEVVRNAIEKEKVAPSH